MINEAERIDFLIIFLPTQDYLFRECLVRSFGTSETFDSYNQPGPIKIDQYLI